MDLSTDSDQVIALIDMDCFYAQVEQHERPESIGKPLAVVQYNDFRRGMVLSANYEARALGVKAAMRIDDAVAKCPELILASAPRQRNKTDLTKFRNASKLVMNVMLEFGLTEDVVVEVASIDEAYLDLTSAVRKILNSRNNFDNQIVAVEDLPTSHVVTTTVDGDEASSLQNWLRRICREHCLGDLKLAVGARLIERLRRNILDQTGYHCSAGIGENKMLAKLVCKMHKPKRQTIIPRDAVSHLFESTPLGDVRNLGGKLGVSVCQRFGIETMGQLAAIDLVTLKEAFKGKTSVWLHQLSRGIDTEEVTQRQLAKSIGCSKNFSGTSALKNRIEIQKWLTILAEELEERLRKDQAANRRTARSISVSIRLGNASSNVSRHCQLSTYESAVVARDAFRIISEFNDSGQNVEQWKIPITNLALSAARFEDCVDVPNAPITDYFKPAVAASRTESVLIPSLVEDKNEDVPEISVIPKPKLVDLDEQLSPSSDLCILDDNSNIEQFDVETEKETCTESPTSSNANFDDSEVWAPTHEGAQKRKLLAEKTTADFFSSQREKKLENKQSFFLKRLQKLRQRDEAKNGDEVVEIEKTKADETEKRRRVQEKVKATLLVPLRKKNEASTSALNFVDVEGWLPEERTAIDDETWNDLPPDVRWELKQHFKRCGNQEAVSPTKSSSSNKGQRTVRESKKTGKRSKKGTSVSATATNIGSEIRTLTDYFDRS